MTLLENASFISAAFDYGEVCPVFKKQISIKKPVHSAELLITAMGVYEAHLNGKRIGDFFMAPGWTAYHKRLQVQKYDIKSLLSEENELCITVGKGWAVGRLVNATCFWAKEPALICDVIIVYEDGETVHFPTNDSWQSAKTGILMSEIYDGELFDARITPTDFEPVREQTLSKKALIEQEGEIVSEQEHILPKALFLTPKGETVIDFGQNMTGFVKFKAHANAGDRVRISHAETLDKDGNFYTDNLRSAKCQISYICNGVADEYQPHFTFQGFRYIRIDEFPGDVNIDCFEAIVVHSNLKRTGFFECSSPLLTQLYNNTVWGLKSNFLDVPTDCPQRDERLGWTGDAQVFIKTAAYHYDVNRFFTKWLHDLKAEQFENGGVPNVVPNVLGDGTSAAWGDAATICPWNLYLAYGNDTILKEQFLSMKHWVDYIKTQCGQAFLWNTPTHFGDWLALDCDNSHTDGGTDKGLIATAFYANSVFILVKTGRMIGEDICEYETLYQAIVTAFQENYLPKGRPICDTQTAHVLALAFQLTPNPEETAKGLVKLIRENGNKLSTGFVGTPYLLHVLSDNGYADVAYDLILQEEYPSWLYSVKKGATTIWEHWDGIRPDGTMWSDIMNSFNHYAYGAVSDFLYSKMIGISPDEGKPGYRHILFSPIVDNRLSYARGSLQVAFGKIESSWKILGG